MLPTSPSIQDTLASLTTASIAQILISRYGTLAELAKAPIEELQSVPGIGPKKAQQLQSAFELARSMSRELALEQPITLWQPGAKDASIENLTIKSHGMR